MNRGIAHRSAFETRADARMFLAQVARAVHSGAIELHAFCVLNTHYHLFVRSVDGLLSATMQRIQNAYVRWFNQTRGRDGPLFRGRFQSRRVTSETYKRILVRYIDDNPCDAGLVDAGYLYLHGSARHYVRGVGPPWLTRSWVESAVAERTGAQFAPEGYLSVFGAPLDEQQRMHLVRTIEASTDPQEALEDLLGATPARVLAWLAQRALVADGGGIGFPLTIPREVTRAIGEAAGDIGTAHLLDREELRIDMHTALLFELCGLSQVEVADFLGLSRCRVSEGCRLHRRRITESVEYAACTRDVMRIALQAGRTEAAVSLRDQAIIEDIGRGG